MGLSFVIEIAMLVGFGYWGHWVGDGVLVEWILAVGIPVAASVIWGLFFAPKAKRRLSSVPGIGLSLALFLISAAAVFQAGQFGPATAMAVVAVVNRAFVVLWRQW
jgi:hypothetical protein